MARPSRSNPYAAIDDVLLLLLYGSCENQLQPSCTILVKPCPMGLAHRRWRFLEGVLVRSTPHSPKPKRRALALLVVLMQAHEVHDNNQAVRGSQYLGPLGAIRLWGLLQTQTRPRNPRGSEGPALGSEFLTAGDKWDLFKHQMPVYLVDHINGNAIYNLKHPWTRRQWLPF